MVRTRKLKFTTANRSGNRILGGKPPAAAPRVRVHGGDSIHHQAKENSAPIADTVFGWQWDRHTDTLQSASGSMDPRTPRRCF